MDFARTQLGYRFFDQTLPSLVRELGRLADATGRLAEATGRVADALGRSAAPPASHAEPGPAAPTEAR